MFNAHAPWAVRAAPWGNFHTCQIACPAMGDLVGHNVSQRAVAGQQGGGDKCQAGVLQQSGTRIAAFLTACRNLRVWGDAIFRQRWIAHPR